MLKKFIKYYKPYKGLFFLDLAAALLLASCELVYPMITRRIIDTVIPSANTGILTKFGIILAIIFVIKACLNYFMQYWGHVVGVRMQADMRKFVFTHLQKLPNKYFDENKSGVTMSRIVNDLQDITELAHHGPEDLFISIIMLIGSFIILFRINIELTVIVYLLFPVMLIYLFKKKDALGRAFLKTREKVGEVNATLENSIAGMKVTKSFGTEENERGKFNSINNMFKDVREYAYKVMAECYSGMNLNLDILQWIVAIVGAIFAIRGRISIGEFTAYILYVNMFIQPMKKLINFTDMYQNGMTGYIRFQDIMDEDTQKEAKNPIELKDVRGRIEFKDVSFAYESYDKDENKGVLKDINLIIEPGTKIALAGPSGGGKTTICNLIPRFYEYQEGIITIDGKDIKSLSLESLRRNIGIVQQDVFLFTGTIRENILIGNPDATDEELIEASKSARLHDFIMDLPEGYDTFIGERGVKLSGGQKQRISIARIFLKNPPIIILDEATSALDNITEREIQASLDKLSEGRTTLIVAHRLSTIRNADRIIIINKGQVEESGTHEKLLEKKGFYYRLHQ